MKDTYCTHCGAEFCTPTYPKNCICGEVTFTNPLPVAVLLVPVNDGLLAVRRAFEPQKGFLSLPGGYMELGETWQEACARELKEETSIKVSPQDVKLFDVVTGTLSGHILVFGIVPSQAIDDFQALKHDTEVTEITVVTDSQAKDLAFASHISVATRYFIRAAMHQF